MKEALAQIRTLQELNRQIHQLQQDLDKLTLDERNQQRILEEHQRRAQQIHQERLAAAKKVDSVQLSIEEAEQTIAKLQLELNRTKHQKEYDAIQHAIMSRRADISRWEDEELEALQRVDALRAQERQMEETIRLAKEELQRLKTQTELQAREYRERIKQLEEKRALVREQINPAVLAAYERLIASRGNNALAEVKDRICQGCFTRVTKQTENLLMRGNEIVYCHSCGRILVLVE